MKIYTFRNTKRKKMILKISAKCSDMCFAVLVNDKGIVVKEHDGYVPSLLGGGDYIELDIDVATGRIMNWKIPTEADIKEFVGDDPFRSRATFHPTESDEA
jgi:hypothetical protein